MHCLLELETMLFFQYLYAKNRNLRQ
jgi:hypothetical protein